MSFYDNHVTEDEFKGWETEHGKLHERTVKNFKEELKGLKESVGKQVKNVELQSQKIEEKNASFRNDVSREIGQLNTLLDSGLPDRLRPFFDAQLASIDAKLDDFRELKQQTESIHAACQEIQNQIQISGKEISAARDAVASHSVSLRAIMAECDTFLGRLRRLFPG